MKVLKHLAFAFLLAVSVNGIAQNTSVPMSQMEYDQRYTQLLHQPGGDDAKLRTFRQFTAGKTITSQQLKGFASLFISDFMRYEMALDGYQMVSDKQNFYEVYDAFLTFSAAFRLHDAVTAPQLPARPQRPVENMPPIEVKPPKPLPSPPPCQVSPQDFEEAKATIKKQRYSSTMVALAKQVFTAKRCFTAAQTKQILTLFTYDNDRLDVAKFAYDFTVDKENYYTVADVFIYDTNKQALMQYLSKK